MLGLILEPCWMAVLSIISLACMSGALWMLPELRRKRTAYQLDELRRMVEIVEGLAEREKAHLAQLAKLEEDVQACEDLLTVESRELRNKMKAHETNLRNLRAALQRPSSNRSGEGN